MADSAKVLSVQALKDFRVSLINFVEEARNALGGVDMELKRMRDWLERDQLGYWQMQVKRRHEKMMEARTELHRRKLSQQGSDAVSDTEQKENLREAQRKLRVAEEKVEIVKKLIPFFQHAAAEYVSHATPLADHLSGGVDRSLSTLERMVLSLEAYLATQAPSTPRLDDHGGSSSPNAGAARPAGADASPEGAAGAGAGEADEVAANSGAGVVRTDGSAALSGGGAATSAPGDRP
ncbi:hypothetical protein OJF2_56690 [Aquisphaera giovannonii]|uniref:Uncharacterized protein n=1 Tax=Aquisphaera giovannonii TaxID=406548 RepID=A0A5B9W9Z5_9BACT|nr:hypothetical protein [Aquisphaera giovannonii]QEH37084.1 hypothetical protein OJF2_56690 [Aquisphaera giovannonii]